MNNERYSLYALHCQGDKLMMMVAWGLVVVSLGLASWYGTWAEAMVIGVPAALVPTVLWKIMPGKRLTRVAMGASFMIMSALMIHQAHGMIEMHFAIFALLAFLLFYRDWLPVVAAAGLIAVHHLSFWHLQTGGAPIFVFTEAAPIWLVLVHAAFVVAETAVLVYMALQLHREAVQAEEIHLIGEHLAMYDGSVDLSHRIDNARSDFAMGYNAFIETLHALIGKVNRTVATLTASSEELNANSRQAAEAASYQQGQTESVAAAINQMSSAVQAVTSNARAAAEAAEQADSDATQGSQVAEKTTSVMHELGSEVERTTTVMSSLEEKSSSVGVVLDVIKGIAEQTNLLALNAAIEAARAGEQGRGFAVVADEVRSLASRTHESTQEIEEMIAQLQQEVGHAVEAMGRSSEQAQSGIEQSQQVGEALNRIADSIRTINTMNTQIASATNEQNSVADEINRSISTISETSNRTADEAQSVAASIRELTDMAEELSAAVSAFKV